MRIHPTTFAALAVLTSAPGLARAATYYASPTGNGTGTMASPFSVNTAAARAAAGDTVYLRGGTYSGSLRPTNSGNSGAWITFAAYPGELPIFNGNGSGGTGVAPTGQYLRFVGIAVQNYSSTGFGNGWTDGNCSSVSNGNLEFVNVIAEGNGINGIAFYCATGLLIEGSIVFHNGNMLPSWSSGVNVFHAMGASSANVVRRTVSFENIDISANRTDGSGFILDQNSTGATFVNNIGFRNGGSCIRLTNSGNSIIENNTCFSNGMDPNVQYHDEIFYSNPNTRVGAVLRNNVAVASSGHNATFGATGVTQENNLFLNNGAAAPFFTSTTGRLDFHLTASATTLIDLGTATGAPADDAGFDPACIKQESGPVSWWQYAADYDYIRSIGGVAACFAPRARVGAPDIGAYEWNATGGAGGMGGTGGGGAGGRGGAGGAGTGGAGGGGRGGAGAAGMAGTGGGGGTAGRGGAGAGGTVVQGGSNAGGAGGSNAGTGAGGAMAGTGAGGVGPGGMAAGGASGGIGPGGMAAGGALGGVGPGGMATGGGSGTAGVGIGGMGGVPSAGSGSGGSSVGGPGGVGVGGAGVGGAGVTGGNAGIGAAGAATGTGGELDPGAAELDDVSPSCSCRAAASRGRSGEVLAYFVGALFAARRRRSKKRPAR